MANPYQVGLGFVHERTMQSQFLPVRQTQGILHGGCELAGSPDKWCDLPHERHRPPYRIRWTGHARLLEREESCFGSARSWLSSIPPHNDPREDRWIRRSESCLPGGFPIRGIPRCGGDSHGFGESACIVQFPLMPLAVMNGEQAKISPLCQKLVSQYGGVEPSEKSTTAFISKKYGSCKLLNNREGLRFQ